MINTFFHIKMMYVHFHSYMFSIQLLMLETNIKLPVVSSFTIFIRNKKSVIDNNKQVKTK